MGLTTISTLVALAAVLSYGLYRLLSIGRRPKGYPPGPPTVPLLGNIHLMPTEDPHLQFQKWAVEYGDIYSLMLGTKTLIVLSGDEVIKELLDRRSNNYSGRPEMYIAGELASDNLRVLTMSYGPMWRSIRKMIHQLLNVTVVSRYVPYQMLENKQMLNDLLDTPDKFLEHIRRYSNAVTTTMVFGWRSPTYGEPNIQQLYDGFAKFCENSGSPAAFAMDAFPWLKLLPDFLVPVKKKAKELHKIERALYLKHWLKAKKEFNEGTLVPCFCIGMAETQKKEKFSDAQAAYISGTLLEAGSDTTAATIYAFVQAMLLYPDVQHYAQQQIDAVVGQSRLPTWEDQADIPIVRMLYKETLRWMPVTITGAVPHAALKDDTYNGYFIPAGAGVMNNAWNVNHHPSRAPNARAFDPMRHKDDHLSLFDSATRPDPSKRDQFTFGAGRRICAGMHVAERSLYIVFSRLLWAFDIEPATNEKGEPIIPDQERLTSGLAVMPVEFPAKITPRSKEKAEIVRREWAVAERELLDPITKQWIASPL